MTNTDTLPTTRASALNVASTLFFTGRKCASGHTSVRYTSTGICRECSRDRNKSAYLNNVVREKARSAAWREDNPGKYQAQYKDRDQRAANKKWREDNPEAQRDWWKSQIMVEPLYAQLRGVKARCQKHGWLYDLDAEHIMELYRATPDCPVLKVRMLLPNEPGDRWHRMSIDRLDPALGYVRSNVRLLSYAANTIKGQHTDPQIFRRLADWLEKEQS